MTWATTIATFLGTIVAALFMFIIFSRREQILEALREQRIERRIPAEVALELSSLGEPLFYENALTENASRRGARVVAKRSWLRNDHVLVRLPRADERLRARIAYCNALPGDAFAIGLQFSSVVEDWVIPRSDMSDDDLSGRAYRK